MGRSLRLPRSLPATPDTLADDAPNRNPREKRCSVTEVPDTFLLVRECPLAAAGETLAPVPTCDTIAEEARKGRGRRFHWETREQRGDGEKVYVE